MIDLKFFHNLKVPIFFMIFSLLQMVLMPVILPKVVWATVGFSQLYHL